MAAARRHLIVQSAGGVLGYVHAREEYYAFRLIRANDSVPLREAELDVSDELAAVLAGSEALVAQRLAQSQSAEAFAVELAAIIEQLPSAPSLSTLPSETYYTSLISQLDEMGWDALASLNDSLSVVELTLQDAAGRAHALTLELPFNFPRSPPSVRCQLPADFEVTWPASAKSARSYDLSTVLSQFRAQLSAYQELWDVLDDLDAHTAVLEPSAPTRDQCARRVALGRHSSLQLRLNPSSARALPELFFFGSETVVAPLRARLNERLGVWDAARSVRENLELVLELEFPRPSAANAEEFSVECGVCYTYKLEDTIPECACDGCNQVFHHGCLLEWLQALPNSKSSFNSVFGTCPYCSKPMSIKAHQ